MKSWAIGESDFGGDEWEEEIRLTEEAVEAINKMCPKPKFFALCGDLVHSMPGRQDPLLVTITSCLSAQALSKVTPSHDVHVLQ